MAGIFAGDILTHINVLWKEEDKMDKETEKAFLEKMDALAQQIADQKWPRMGGLIVKKSHCCRSPVVLVGKGILSYVCSECGKVHHEPVYR